MGRLEVRNTDRPDLSGFDQLLERLPGGDILIALRQRPVDQQQINVVQAKLTQALVETSNRTLVSLKLAIQLGRDEHLLAMYAAIPDALAHATLVAIAVGGVDVTVADFDGGNDHWCDRGIVERSGAQTDLGHSVTVVETEGWYTHGVNLSLAPKA